MILFQNSVIKLNYNPGSDILEVHYQDLHSYLLPEIKHSIDILVEVVKNYDIKYLLLDSTATQIPVQEEQSREIANNLAASLIQTRVQKVARVQSLSQDVNKYAQENIQHVNQAFELPIELKNFTEKEKALAWLCA